MLSHFIHSFGVETSARARHTILTRTHCRSHRIANTINCRCVFLSSNSISLSLSLCRLANEKFRIFHTPVVFFSLLSIPLSLTRSLLFFELNFRLTEQRNEERKCAIRYRPGQQTLNHITLIKVIICIYTCFAIRCVAPFFKSLLFCGWTCFAVRSTSKSFPYV